MDIGFEHKGFVLEQQSFLTELDTTAYLFRHKTLGCCAFALKNQDPNKTFCIAFRTIPTDSTGVAHILEHSVLMGSDKYPVKDVFGEINKGGLMTFLNAMTGADTTWYPFATRNLKEYFSIMDVYCDVCFYPLLQHSTFEQEGWHYHQEDAESPLQYQGVVFNEMKGAFSDPIRALFHQSYKGLMPESTYAHESGGDPRDIPNLTYEAFVDFHENHYHPSNCTLFFYGDADILEELAYVEDHFLSRFEQAVARADITPGEDIHEPVIVTDTYPVQPGTPLTGKTFLAVSSVIGTVADRKRNTAFQIIANILFNSDASPLKNAILSHGLCKDFGGLFLHNSSYKTVMLTYLVGSDPDKREAFLDLYRSTLRDMVDNGLDRELILSELNKFEFSLREDMNKAQRGLDMIGKALPALKHDLDPFEALDSTTLLAEIREQALEHQYLEELIRDRLLDNPATVTVSLGPDPGQLARTMRLEQEHLERYNATLTPEARDQLIARTRELMELQTMANSDEDLNRLPRLTRDDLSLQADFHQVRAERLANREFLVNELPTNGICYLDFGFDVRGVDPELLPYLELFGTLVTEIGTADKDFMHLAKELNLYTGGFSHGFNSYLHLENAEAVRPIQWYHLKTLSQYLDRAVALVEEIFRDVSFADRRRIREVVQREFAWEEHSVQSEGYQMAATRAFSQLSPAGRYYEQINGATAHLILKDLAHHYEAREDAFLEKLGRLKEQLLTRNTLLFNITGESSDIDRFQVLGPAIVSALPEAAYPLQTPQVDELPRSEAFTTSAEVVFNVQAGPLFPRGQGYNGHFEVLKTWLSRDYLWNTVRQQGGAYGCFVQFNNVSGNCGMVSYRDPQIGRTYETYEQAAKRIAELALSPDMLTQLIIGTYGNFTPLQGPAAKGTTARNDYFTGVTAAYRQERLEEILATSLADLREFSGRFAAMQEQRFRVTIGNQALIEKNRQLFDRINEL